ncbi:hypothetical protein ABMA32_22415 [Mesorhizobium sp. VNQ89]|uniref:hypothetical protein n=1 Tax=Mesorhizobium quangtriensis TaxID=3157709 RepID=UPI0032B7E8BE
MEEESVTDEIEWSLTDTIVWIARRERSAVRDSRAEDTSPILHSFGSKLDAEDAWSLLTQAIRKKLLAASGFSPKCKLHVTKVGKHIQFQVGNGAGAKLKDLTFSVKEVLTIFPPKHNPYDIQIDFSSERLSLYSAAIFIENGDEPITYRAADHDNHPNLSIFERGTTRLLEGLRKGTLVAEGFNVPAQEPGYIDASVWRYASSEPGNSIYWVALCDYRKGLLDAGTSSAGGSIFVDGDNEARWVQITIPKEQLVAFRGKSKPGAKRIENLRKAARDYPAADLEAWFLGFTDRWKAGKVAGSLKAFEGDAEHHFPNVKREPIRKFWDKFEGRKPRYKG